ncbi:MAG: GNAT family N-acetyltransferase [Oscillospiraceae bacterium]|nr:GNAT family N-acetyltransferase [Oscillospiraceae bacterium]
MIVEVDRDSVAAAAQIHSCSWQESHRSFCSREFVELHSAERQKAYLTQEIDGGKRLYMLVEEKPVGIVSVKDDLIENLYVLPQEQHKGYGTRLLRFATEQCTGTPCLWVLENNERAFSLYSGHGFRLTGARHALSAQIAEAEMRFEAPAQRGE